MISALNAGVEVILVKDGYMPAHLDDEPRSWVEEAATALAPKKSLWGRFTVSPCGAGGASSRGEFLRETVAGTTRAHELPIEGIIGPLDRGDLVLVSLDGQAGNNRIEGLDNPESMGELSERCSFLHGHGWKVHDGRYMMGVVSLKFGQGNTH
jgi:hypothetical protein